MKYDYQYDICAITLTITIMIIYLIRSRYLSKTNKIYLSLVICDCVAAIFDLISCFTVSYIEIVPLWINVVIAFGFLLFYNHMSIFFFVYIWKKSGITVHNKQFRYICIISSVFYLVTLSTSQLTHAVFYFENNEYCHGPLMPVFYTMPIVMMAMDAFIFIRTRKNFTKDQFIGSIIMIVLMVFCVGVPIVFPRVLVGQFSMAIVMFFIYITYENPGYYTYLDTNCLNRTAFMEDFINQKKNKMAIIQCQEFALLGQKLDFHIMELYQKKIAEQISEVFGKDVFNISDDRYVILIDENSDINLHKIIEQINDSVKAYNYNVKIIWINEIQGFTANDMELLIYNADKDINTAEEIRNQLEILNQEIESKNKLLNCIIHAIENQKFEVYYQPIYNVNTGKFDSAEALIRLIDTELGFINPEEMIIMAEKHGYINNIGDIVFEKVCKFYADNNLEAMGIHYIEVNFSPKQCLRNDLVDSCLSIMSKYSIKPQHINLEITETADYENNNIIIETFERFSQLGFYISLDDYGSGYASPNYIIRFPMNYIKIDKLILWEAIKNDEAMKVFENIINMVKSIGKKVIVEGAESEEMVELLKKLKCDHIQGYYYSKPLPEAEFLKFIETRK